MHPQSLNNTIMSYMQMAQLDELARYFADKAQTQIDALWDNGTINEQTIEAWGNERMRNNRSSLTR